MSIWISVYCQQPVPDFSASNLEAAIAEGCVDYRGDHYFHEMFQSLQVNEYSSRGRDSQSLFHVKYALKDSPRGRRTSEESAPITLDRIVDREVVESYVLELLEDYLKGRRGPKATAVRQHLARTVEIYSFGLKDYHYLGKGRIVIGAARQWLAQLGKGMVREDGVGWLEWTRHGFFSLLKE